MEVLAINTKTKLLNFQDLFSVLKVLNNNLINIKKQIIYLSKELVEYKIIHNQLKILYKSDSKKQIVIEYLTISNIIR